MPNLNDTLDTILDRSVTAADPAARVPGVVATVTRADGTLYEGAAGARSVDGEVPMTTDSVFCMFSTTKAITATAALQCTEEGLLDLDAPAAEYVPEIAELQVIEGFDDEGGQRLRAPLRPITTRMLLLHTAGLGYMFFSGLANLYFIWIRRPFKLSHLYLSCLWQATNIAGFWAAILFVPVYEGAIVDHRYHTEILGIDENIFGFLALSLVLAGAFFWTKFKVEPHFNRSAPTA